MKQYKDFYGETMKFTAAEFYTLNPIKLQKPFYDATGGPFDELPISNWLVLYDQNGIAGQCPCSPILKEVLLPFILTGEEKTYSEWYLELYWKIRNRGFSGESAIELGRLDLVFHDILSKRAGMPLHRFLGADRDWVAVYASGCGTGLSTEETVEEVERFLAKGYTTVKMKIAAKFGTRIEEDLERIRLVRELIGKDRKLAIDANQVWNADQALAFARQAAVYDIAWFEEPVHSHDIEGLEKLIKNCPIPVAMGESLRNHYSFYPYVQAGVRQLQPVATNLSGVGEWMKVRDMAEKYQLGLTSGGTSQLIASFVATAGEESMVEYLEPVLGPCFDIMSLAPIEKNGRFYLPSEPGISISPDFKLLERLGYIACKEYMHSSERTVSAV